jgi:hypothetical protein
MALLAIAVALPLFADEPVWRRDFGLRVGGAGSFPIFLPFAGSISAFYEARSDLNWAVRPAIEVTKGREWGIFGDMGYDIGIGRVGAAMDFVYYASSKRPIGTGFFLTTGLGWHRFDIKDDLFKEALRDTQSAASISAGIGCQFGKIFGMEFKYSMSDMDSELAGGIGKNWLTASMNFRLPAPGQRKEEHPRDAAYRARKIAKRAEKIAKRAEADKQPPRKHKSAFRWATQRWEKKAAGPSAYSTRTTSEGTGPSAPRWSSPTAAGCTKMDLAVGPWTSTA